MKNAKIKSFTDLNAWKESHKLVLIVYKHTENFPKNEIFGLTNQMRRAAVSVVSNIAEGFSRSTARDKCNFYAMSHGSLTELQSQLIIARDLNFLEKNNFDKIAYQTVEVAKLISGLKRIGNS